MASADDLLKANWPAPGGAFRPPIDPYWLAESFGFVIHHVEGLPSKCSGWIEPAVLEGASPREVAHSLGLLVFFPGNTLPEQLEFVLRPDAQSRRRICLNDAHPQARKRFTLAHEFGHYVLHDELGVSQALFRDGSHSPFEREADIFATALLMPEVSVRYWWPMAAEEHSDPVSTMSDWFSVSRSSMARRLRELKLV